MPRYLVFLWKQVQILCNLYLGDYELVQQNAYALNWAANAMDQQVGTALETMFASFMNLFRATARVQEEHVSWQYKPTVWQSIRSHWVVLLIALTFLLINLISVIAFLIILIVEDTGN